ncbi:hypothetical protein AMK16_21085 [Streptomyces sp. CB00455]|uniref:hypothetical protein n=1 Tax=Streptomyces sp. CB00455 TaxID=1703927 RepID=UPI00093CA142|nr:hypothetical protein [Streptomyces sp. CB00455]OKK17349.1 hypothetical protein AMK16_21085 [Streptomyces sp. CB00455]
MEREIDIDQLVAAMKAVDEAGLLFEEALAVYEARGPRRTGDDFTVAGGSVQTLQGAEEMVLGARRLLAELALITGYTTAGLDERVGGRAVAARKGFAGLAGGGSRMGRPLLEPTLRGLRLLLAVDLFDPEFRAEIEAVVRAEKATYPEAMPLRVPRPVAGRPS